MDSQYKLLSELLSDQAAFITSSKTSLANYWGDIAPLPPPSVYGPVILSCLEDNMPFRINQMKLYHLSRYHAHHGRSWSWPSTFFDLCSM